VRESVFNILGQRLDEVEFLDLYAGSGAMGLEACSRGARTAVFVEHDAAACDVIRSNIDRLGVRDRTELRCEDVADALASLGRSGTGFDVVFADPPYSDPPEGLQALVSTLAAGAIVAPGGSLVLQQRRGVPVPAHPAFSRGEPRHYGITSIVLFDRLT
jgi:16S rRNA (guanine(966)-N(2))-methyltransferase RsmD